MKFPAVVFFLFVLFASTGLADTAKKHLFILSGQSNMQGHRPDEAFIPAVAEAFGAENVVVVQDAQGGQPIRRWIRGWKAPNGDVPEGTADLYERLMAAVEEATEGWVFDTVTLFWMQGERDAREGNGEVYAENLRQLHRQVCEDLGRDDVFFVIGRLSDFDMANKTYPHWTKIRGIQVEVAGSDPKFSWVDTDDLNDGMNRGGKPIENDLHYSGEGYKTFGKRMAEKAIALIRGN